jgi:hypothetical protein
MKKFTKYVKLFENSQADFKAGDIVTVYTKGTNWIYNVPVKYKNGAKREKTWKDGRFYPDDEKKPKLEVISTDEFDDMIVCKPKIPLQGSPVFQENFLVAFPADALLKYEENNILHRLCFEIEKKSVLRFSKIGKEKASVNFYMLESEDSVDDIGYFSEKEAEEFVNFLEKNRPYDGRHFRESKYTVKKLL